MRIAPDEVSVSDPQAVHLIYGVKSSFRKTDFYDPFSPKHSSNGDLFTIRDEKLHTERRKIVNSIYNMVCASLGVVLCLANDVDFGVKRIRTGEICRCLYGNIHPEIGTDCRLWRSDRSWQMAMDVSELYGNLPPIILLT